MADINTDIKQENLESPDQPDPGSPADSDKPCPACIRATIINGLLSAILLGLGGGNGFFLIPLQYVRSKRGVKPFTAASAGAVLIGLVILLAGSTMSPLVMLVLVAGNLGALWILNDGDRIFARPLQSWQRLLAAGVVSTVGTALSLVILEGMNIWEDFRWLLVEMPELAALFAGLGAGSDVDQLIELARSLMYRFLTLSSLGGLLFAYAIGRSFARGTADTIKAASKFRLPPVFIWMFIIPGGAVLLSELTDFIPGAYLFWNIFLMSVILYVLAGLAIVFRYGMRRRLLASLLPGVLVLSVFVPVLNISLMAIMLLVGISSVWIEYSDGTGSGSLEDDRSGSAENN